GEHLFSSRSALLLPPRDLAPPAGLNPNLPLHWPSLIPSKVLRDNMNIPNIPLPRGMNYRKYIRH
ncbi:unnamed protein product, partial [Ectocarpus sp. 4 AP-2014]